MRYEQSYEKGCDCGFAEYRKNEDGTVDVKNCCERLPSTDVGCSKGLAVLSYPDAEPLEGRFNVSFRGREFIIEYSSSN